MDNNIESLSVSPDTKLLILKETYRRVPKKEGAL